MLIRSSTLLCLLFSSLSTSTTIAQSTSPINWVGGFALGYTRLSFPSKLDADPSFASYVVYGSASYRNFYLNVNYSDAFSDEDISEEEDFGQASRHDLDISVGYHLNDRFMMYVGYKDSETDIDFQQRDSQLTRDEFYKQDGFFIGTTYSIDLNEAGSISINLAYTELDTNNLFRSDEEDEDEGDDTITEFDDLQGHVNGNADGWSYGISWVVPVTDNLAMNTVIKVNDYEENIAFEGKTFSADQTVTFFNVGVVYLF